MLTQPFWEVWSTLHCGRQLLLRWSAAGSRKPKITKRQSKKFAKVVENAKDPPKLPCFCKQRVWHLVNFCSGWSSHSPSDWTGSPWFLFVKNMNILHIMIMRHTMCHVVICTLNISFFSASLSGGIATAFPISPGFPLCLCTTLHHSIEILSFNQEITRKFSIKCKQWIKLNN